MKTAPTRVTRTLASHVRRTGLAAVALATLGLAGCNTRSPETTGSIGDLGGRQMASRPEAPSRQDLDALAERFNANPGDGRAAIAYARALRVNDQAAQASAVLQQAALRNPRDTFILGAYGKSLVEAGRYREAIDVLANAHSPASPDWRILSAQGSASAQLGEQARAQSFYEAALKIRPNEPSLLSNLGLSYALSRNLDQAEQTLRLAADQPGADARVRANLALVLGLKGRFADAETVLRRDMGPEEAAANVASLRKLAAQPNRFKALSGTPQQG
ncbi:CDC27 family protein [Methylobacterium pseudosasicola]|uniref:Flp pilus assembly protein TadD, contains TPR repeats n=1 Tax=Methylobacterium pseudosasicola TaxID=582667 RepID=A0A1I4FG34_9HYPH|nr:CDC27 family protein [Methylobacterium pseudosasicola]SFL16892.1 Flp pilus assembly protein TadD, contains TPR repeats [Methylobacterium pseudosasicola]